MLNRHISQWHSRPGGHGCSATWRSWPIRRAIAACSTVDDLTPDLPNLRFDRGRHHQSALFRQRPAQMGTRHALALRRARHRRLEVPGSVDWHKRQGSGVSFAFIKATEGGDRVDDIFDENWRKARRRPACRAAPITSTISAARPPSRRAGSSPMCPRKAARCRRCSTWSGTRIRRPASCGPPAATVRSEMRIFLDDGREALRQEADHLHLDRFLRRQGLSGFPGYQYWLRSVAGHPTAKIWQPSVHLLAVHRHRRRSRHQGQRRHQRLQRQT